MIDFVEINNSLNNLFRVVKEMREGDIPIFIEWTGKTDVSPEDLGEVIGKVLAKMGVFSATEEIFDAVKILREEWGMG